MAAILRDAQNLRKQIGEYLKRISSTLKEPTLIYLGGEFLGGDFPLDLNPDGTIYGIHLPDRKTEFGPVKIDEFTAKQSLGVLEEIVKYLVNKGYE